MRVLRVTMSHFRGVREGIATFDGHTLLVGGNGSGKSTICEALDLVLGPERLSRRPVVDEHDFWLSHYRGTDGDQPQIRIEVLLTDLDDAAVRRFASHLRPWSSSTADFYDAEPVDLDLPESAELEWVLPLVFLARFDESEDDFVAGTFFAHPEPDGPVDPAEPVGTGLRVFTREDKRYCGFLYLRPNRTGSRALSFQRGSLLDTVVRLEADLDGGTWEQALDAVRGLVLTDEGSGFARTREAVAGRIRDFLRLDPEGPGADVLAGELTREHLREVLRLFVAAEPLAHPLPISRLSTGARHLLVFAMLTYIAELKGEGTVIFAIEEPEAALPPHAQRQLVDYGRRTMSQVIVTSHSPYVIERFSPAQIVLVARDEALGMTTTGLVFPEGFKLRTYHGQKRQFAEAILGRGVLVLEGSTETAAFPVVADLLAAHDGTYVHPDLAGLTLFDAQGDVNVPRFAAVFAGLGKRTYGAHDTPRTPFSAELQAKTTEFELYRVLPYSGIEDLLVAETAIEIQRTFLIQAADREDYPTELGTLAADADDAAVSALLHKVLCARKGAATSYAALMLATCDSIDQAPASIVTLLRDINSDLHPPGPVAPAGPAAEPGPAAAPDDD